MSEANATATQIVINLAKGQDVRRLGPDEFIQREALERFAKIIKARIRVASLAMEPGDADRLHDADGTPLFSDRRHATIVVRGKRGSGKTTFIRNALALLDKGELDEYLAGSADDGAKLRQSVVRLGVIDPTLIETKEHPFIVVVTKVKQAVERYRKQHGDGGWAGRPSYQEWQKSLQDLAKGIVLLEGVGKSHPLTDDGWDDPLYVMQQGLEKAGAGKGLEQELDQFLIMSLRFLGKKAFILALDDIDTDFNRGWDVLELLRKYLTSPCLITIMTGDLELYSMLVRGKQWDKFSKPMLDNEKEKKDVAQRRLMVNHLQDQYLFKVLPAHSQIGLLPVSRLSVRDQIQVVARADDGRDVPPMPLSDFMHRLVVEGFGMGTGAVPLVKELLLSQPLRSLLQIMGEARINADKKLVIPPQELPAIFTYPLVRCGLTPEDLAGINGAGIFPILVRLFTDRQLWEGGHALFPNHEDEDVSLSLLVLNVVVRAAIQENPSLAIGYMTRIALAYEFLAARLSGLLNEPAERLQPFIDYVGLDRRVSVTFTASRIAVAIAAGEKKAQQLGVIQVYNDSSRRTARLMSEMFGGVITNDTKIINQEFNHTENVFVEKIKTAYKEAEKLVSYLDKLAIKGNYYNSVDSMVGNIPTVTQKWLASIPICRGLRPNGEQPTYLTVHRLIALIGRLLELAKPVNAEDIARLLRDEGLIRSYAQPPWLDSNKGQSISEYDEDADEPEAVDGIDVDDNITQAASSDMVQALQNWLANFEGGELPPHIHSRIAARFFYTLAGIDNSIVRREFYLGHLLHRHIIAFLNAVLVEELLFLDAEGPVTLKNPISSDQPFERNLKRSDACHYFKGLFSCPLWFVYLKKSSNLLKSAVPIHENDESSLIAVNYRIPNLYAAALKVTKDETEASRLSTITFDSLYDLYNSVGVLNVKAARNPALPEYQESSKSTEQPKTQSKGSRKSKGDTEVTNRSSESLSGSESEPAAGER